VELQSLAQVLEAAMLVCFGAAWPFSIWKQWRTQRTEGRSLRFIVMVLAGYIAGIAAKLTRAVQAGAAPEAVTVLYALNAAMVVVDMALFLRCRTRSAASAHATRSSNHLHDNR
jgi:uncharacterized membrane protein